MLPGPSSARANQEIMNQLWSFVESFFSNADRASWDATAGRESEWRPGSTYEDAYAERGATGPAGQALGAYSRVMEPDLIGLLGSLFDAGRAARPAARAADVAEAAPAARVATHTPVTNPETGLPMTLYRSQAPGGGVGPIARDMGLTETGARYYGQPEYVRGFAMHEPGNVLVEGQMAARPGGLWDATNPGSNPDLMARVMEAAVSEVPDAHRAMLLRSIDNFSQGIESEADFLHTLRTIFGRDMAGVADRAGLDVLLQRPDDFRAPSGIEAVAFNQQAFQPSNTVDPRAFVDVYSPYRR